MERSSARRFPQRHRLADERSFAHVFAGATRSRDRYFTVLYRGNTEDMARLGLAIAKKHCKKAVDRNRIKRIVRESFRHHNAQLAGLDIVVLNRPEASSADNRDLFASLETHWRRCEMATADGKR